MPDALPAPPVAPPAPPPATGAPPPDDANRTFTQAELDRIVGERLARHKAEVPEDYEDLKAAKTRLDEIEDASRSELEKAQRERDEARAEAATAAQRSAAALVRAAVLVEARGAADPSDVYALLPKDPKTSLPTGLTVGDDGAITGAAEAVKALLEAKPHLAAAPNVGSADGGARGDATGRASSMEDAVNKRLQKT